MYTVHMSLLSFSYILRIKTFSFFFKVLNSWNGKWNVIAGSKERIKHLKTENREPKENKHLKADKRISKRKRSELCSVICLLRNKYFIMQRLIEDFICFTLSKSVAVAYKSLVNRWCFFVKHKEREGDELVRSFNNHSQI